MLRRASHPAVRLSVWPAVLLASSCPVAHAAAQGIRPAAGPPHAQARAGGRLTFGRGRRDWVEVRPRDSVLVVRFSATRLADAPTASGTPTLEPYVATAVVSRAAVAAALAQAWGRADRAADGAPAVDATPRRGCPCGGGRADWVGADTVLAVPAAVGPVPSGEGPSGHARRIWRSRLVLYCWGDGERHAARLGLDRGPDVPPALRLLTSAVADLPDGARVAALLARAAGPAPGPAPP